MATVALTACSSASVAEIDGCTTGTPLATSTSQSGALQISVCTSFQPPVESLMTGRITVKDTAGHPMDGLTLSVTPWMPAMGHGQSLAVTITPLGNGDYQVAPLELFMAGEWELATKVSGTVTDSANPSFYVP